MKTTHTGPQAQEAGEFVLVRRDLLAKVLVNLDPPPVEIDGQTKIFVNPMAARVLQIISADVRSMVDKSKQATPARVVSDAEIIVARIAALNAQPFVADNKGTRAWQFFKGGLNIDPVVDAMIRAALSTLQSGAEGKDGEDAFRKLYEPDEYEDAFKGRDLQAVMELAEGIWRVHFTDEAPDWKPERTIAGCLSQISNMVAGLDRNHRIQSRLTPNEILNCARCGNDFIECFGSNSGGWFVGCKPCSKANGEDRYGHATTRTEAINRWNERQNTALQPGQGAES